MDTTATLYRWSNHRHWPIADSGAPSSRYIPVITEGTFAPRLHFLPLTTALWCLHDAYASSSLAAALPYEPRKWPAPSHFLDNPQTELQNHDDVTSLGQDLPYSQLLYRSLHFTSARRLTLQESYQ